MNKIFVLTLMMILLLAVSALAVSTVTVSNTGTLAPVTVTFSDGNFNSDTITFNFNVLYNTDDLDLTSASVTLSFNQTAGTAISNLPTKDNININNGTPISESLELILPSSTPIGTYSFKVKAIVTNADGTITGESSARNVVMPSNHMVDASVDEIKINGEPGDEVTVSFTVTNIGNTNLNNLRLSTVASDLEDSDEDVIETSISPVSVNLATGRTQTFTVTAAIDSRFDTKKFTSSLRLTADGGFEGSIPLKVDVSPLVCPSQSSDSDINVDINNPDDGDGISVLSKVQLDATVENKANEDKRYKVVALLYDLDSERKVDSKTLSQRVNEGDDKDVLVDLEVGDDFDEDSDLALFIKVYENGDEEVSCYSERVDLDFTVPDHRVSFDSLNLGPSVVTCGDLVSGGVVLRNVGLDDENVLFTLSNAQLGLQDTTRDIFISEDRDENTRPLTFSFRVPDNARAGDYNVELKATYSGDQTSDFRKVTVTECSKETVVDNDFSAGSNSGNTVTGSAVNQGFLDKVKDVKIPTMVWVLVDILLVVLIIGALVFLFRKR